MPPVMELGGGKVRRNPPIAISGRQPARKYKTWKNSKIITILIIIIITSMKETSIKVSGMVTAQRQRSDRARLAIKTFLHNMMTTNYFSIFLRSQKF